MMVKKNHSFHMVDMSPWPVLSALSAMVMVLGLSNWFISQNNKLFLLGVVLTVYASCQWWRDVSSEGAYQGHHTLTVINGLKMGMVLFIISEIFFFISFFWGFFHNSLSPSMETGLIWPPKGVLPFNPFQIPLLNTIILLSSGVSITWSHHSLLKSNYKDSTSSMLFTIILGLYFSTLQGVEYLEASFCISDSVYGSSFFLATGFHGAHVVIGTTFLVVTFFRMFNGLLSESHHLGFEAAAWYWHFVDVVWLFLYISIYWWGS